MDSPGVGVSVEDGTPVGERRLDPMYYTGGGKTGTQVEDKEQVRHSFMLVPSLKGGADCPKDAPWRCPGRSCPPSASRGGRHCLDVVVELNPLFLHLVAFSH